MTLDTYLSGNKWNSGWKFAIPVISTMSADRKAWRASGILQVPG
jgi:hypothetical protein